MAYEYKFQGKTVRLEADPSVVAIRFKDPSTKSIRSQATESAGAGPFSTRVEIPGEKITIVPVGPGNRSEAGHASAVKRLNAEDAVARAAPVFRVGNNSVVASDRLLIGTKTPAKVDAIAKKYNLVVLRKDENGAKLQVQGDEDVFALSQKIAKESGVLYAEPDFVTIGKHLPKKPSLSPTNLDAISALPTQYAMQITQALEAHKIQTAAPQITVAVLDEGVDTSHPDLKPAVVGTFDSVDNDSYQEPNTWDGHGTSCAGLVGGRPQNPSGPRGSGMGCSLLAVRIAYSQFDGGDWIRDRAIDRLELAEWGSRPEQQLGWRGTVKCDHRGIRAGAEAGQRRTWMRDCHSRRQ
jgi:thermitase